MRSDSATERRTRMADAAARILIAEGPAAITHRRIATAAGVPVGSANYLYRTRRKLYAAAVEAAEALRGASALAWAGALDEQPRSDTDLARALLDTWYAPRLEADVVRARLEPMLAAMGDPELQGIMRESRPRLLEALGLVIERSERPPVPDLDLLAQVLDGALLYGAGAGTDAITTATHTVARFLALVEGADLVGAESGSY